MSYSELRSGFVKVRKDHYCGWCAEKIPIGERAFSRAYVFDGEINDDRMHLECEQAMRKTPSEDKMDGWLPGDFSRPKAHEARSQDGAETKGEG